MPPSRPSVLPNIPKFPVYNLVKKGLLRATSNASSSSGQGPKKSKHLNVVFAPETTTTSTTISEESSTTTPATKTLPPVLVLIHHVERFTNRDDIEQDDLWYSTHEEMNFRQRDEQMKHLLQDGMDLAQVELKMKLLLLKTKNSTTKTTTAIPSGSTCGGGSNPDEECPRGLELAQPEYAKQAEERRKNSKNAVLATQKLFKSQAKDGTESIARAYSLCCESSKQSAVELAQRDYQFVIDHVLNKKTKTTSGGSTNSRNNSRDLNTYKEEGEEGDEKQQSEDDDSDNNDYETNGDTNNDKRSNLEKERSERPALLNRRQGRKSMQSS